MVFETQRERYDLVLSFASEDREYVNRFVAALPPTVSVFNYEMERHITWGRELYDRLGRVFAEQGQHAIPFVSRHYVLKTWTRFEFRSALRRVAVQGDGYLLPVRFDDSTLAGLPESSAYIDLRLTTPEELAELAMLRLAETDPRRFKIEVEHTPASEDLKPILLLEVEPTKTGPVSDTYPHTWPFYDLHIRNVGPGVARSITVEPVPVSHYDYRNEQEITGELRFKPIGNLLPARSERMSVTSTREKRFGPHLIDSADLFTFMLQDSAGGAARDIRVRYENLNGTALVQDFTLLHNECVPGPVLMGGTRPSVR